MPPLDSPLHSTDDGDLCFSPLVVLGASLVGCLSQASLLVLIFFVSRGRRAARRSTPGLKHALLFASTISLCKAQILSAGNTAVAMAPYDTELFTGNDLLNISRDARAVPMACDAERVHFELLAGHFHAGPAFKVTRDLQPDACLRNCRADATCYSLNVDYKRGICEYASQPPADARIRPSPASNLFVKICLEKPLPGCGRRDWAFERVRDRELVGIPHEKVAVAAESRTACHAACVDYAHFVCRSAEFRAESATCRLSPYTRFSSADKRVRLAPHPAGQLVDYLENSCAQGKHRDGSHAWPQTPLAQSARRRAVSAQQAPRNENLVSRAPRAAFESVSALRAEQDALCALSQTALCALLYMPGREPTNIVHGRSQRDA